MFKWLITLFDKPKVFHVPFNAFDAYDRGFKLIDNPYSKHTPEHFIWRDDWLFCNKVN